MNQVQSSRLVSAAQFYRYNRVLEQAADLFDTDVLAWQRLSPQLQDLSGTYHVHRADYLAAVEAGLIEDDRRPENLRAQTQAARWAEQAASAARSGDERRAPATDSPPPTPPAADLSPELTARLADLAQVEADIESGRLASRDQQRRLTYADYPLA